MRTALALSLVCVMPGVLTAQLLVRPAAAAPGEEFAACTPDRRPCVFTDLQGENTYTVDRESLRRLAAAQPVYAIPIGTNSIKVLLAGINKSRTQIVIATEQRSLPTGVMFTPGLLDPASVHRQYWLSVRNPKSGEEIKAIDVGMFRPLNLAMSAGGDMVWTCGDELQLRRREVRAYNTRSGKLEHSTSADRNASIRLFERGFQLGPTYYAVEVAAGDAPRKHSSPNAYSIAEFTVRRTTAISPKAFADFAIGVVGFQGTTPELREMLEGALAIKLGSAGFRIVERQRLKDLLQEARFQSLGLTDAARAVELGKLVNARFLLFGQLQTTGTISSLALRLVAVEDGTLENGIEVECRDCTADDYLQGLTFLVQDWVEAGR
jgi:hypothetical protein